MTSNSGNSGVPSRNGSNRPPRRPTSGDALSGPVDSTRPSNPWPRLLAFGAFVLVMIVFAGMCFSAYLSTPPREIRVRHNEYEEGLPRFLPVAALGSDERFRTYGGFLAVPPEAPAAPAIGLLSWSPESGCSIHWEALASEGGVRGNYVDPCSDARYAFDGTALHPGARSDLHRLDVTREVSGYVVSFEEVTLGACRGEATSACSAGGEPVRLRMPGSALPEDFGE